MIPLAANRSSLGLILPFAIALLICPVRAQDPVAIAPKIQKVLFENDLIRVTRAAYGPGEGIGFHEHNRGLVIALTDFNAKSTLPNDSSAVVVKSAGSVWWRERTRHKVRNMGKNRMEMIEIELKDTSHHAPVSGEPASVEEGQFAKELDNDDLQVLRLRLDSLGSSPMQAHRQRLTVNLTDGDLRVTSGEGKTEHLTGRPGEIAWSPAGRYEVRNLATRPLEQLSIELKSPTPSASPNMPLKRVVVDNAEFCYIEKGAGEPVVLLHGELGDLRSWDAEINALSAHYRVIAYSRRFHYPNPWPGSGQENILRVHLDDLVRLISKLGLKKVHLVGHGDGGTMALLAALSYPDLVRSAVSADGPVPSVLVQSAEGIALARQRTAMVDSARKLFKRGDVSGALIAHLAFENGGGALTELPQAVQRIVADNARALDAQLRSFDRTGMPLCKDLGRLTPPPLLLLEAESSPPYYHSAFDGFAACAPKTNRATIPNAGHAMIYTHPEAFNRTVLEFLSLHH